MVADFLSPYCMPSRTNTSRTNTDTLPTASATATLSFRSAQARSSRSRRRSGPQSRTRGVIGTGGTVIVPLSLTLSIYSTLSLTRDRYWWWHSDRFIQDVSHSRGAVGIHDIAGVEARSSVRFDNMPPRCPHPHRCCRFIILICRRCI